MVNKRIRIVSLYILLFSLLIFTSCQKGSSIKQEKNGLTIYTTIYPLQYLIEQIGGNHVTVQTVYPPGVDAHTFEPTTKDMTHIATSDAFFYFGSSIEGFVESAAEALASEPVQLISIEQYAERFSLDYLQEEQIIREEQVTKVVEYNPHVWLDPLRLIVIANIIEDYLGDLMPEEKSQFKKNRDEIVEHLYALDEHFFAAIKDKENKYMIVPHEAYDYWEERYGIEQIAISGRSPSEEPSQKYLTEIIQLATEHDVKYIFYEQNTPSKLVDILQEQIDVKVATLHNLAVLTEKDLEEGRDYFNLMENNINTLVEAFSQ